MKFRNSKVYMREKEREFNNVIVKNISFVLRLFKKIQKFNVELEELATVFYYFFAVNSSQ